MRDYLDACLFLAVVFEERDARRCKTFLNTVGYKTHPSGVISHVAISELFVKLLKMEDGLLQESCVCFATRLLTRLLRERRATVEPHVSDHHLFEALKAEDYSVSDDDLCNLVAAVRTGCDRFVTLDKQLLGAQHLKAFLKREHGLKIVEP